MASRQHFALAAQIIGTRPNRKTKRFRDEFKAKHLLENEPREAPTSAVYRMIGAYVPYQKFSTSGTKQSKQDYAGFAQEGARS